MPNSEYRKIQKRNRIMSYFINAAISLIEEEGIENMTIRKVANKAGYNSATIYHYFDNLDELLLFASVKCMNEYMKDVPLYNRDKQTLREWHKSQWRSFCTHSFRRPRIYHFLFFSSLGAANTAEIFERYYEIYPQEKMESAVEYVQFLQEGNFFRRNLKQLAELMEEEPKERQVSMKKLEDLTEMSMLIYRGMLEVMRNDAEKPALEEAVERTVQYLDLAYCACFSEV